MRSTRSSTRRPAATSKTCGRCSTPATNAAPRSPGASATIRAALSTARRRDLITFNPAEGRPDALPERAAEAELNMWQPEETARFLDYVKSDRLSALYELAAYAGLRRAELCGLRWADLDPDGTGLTVRQ